MKVIVINGKPTSGKSTFVKLAKELYQSTYELSMVDLVKLIAKDFGWDEVKDEKGRRLLADIKATACRYNPNIIYEDIDTSLRYYANSCYYAGCDPIFFINARNPADINYLVKKYNAVSLFIDNPNVPMVESNPEDKGVENYRYDVTIVNDGTMDELKAKAEKFLEELNHDY